MNVLKVFLQNLLHRIGRTNAQVHTIESFEMQLPTNVIIIPWTTALTNPTCFIVKSPSSVDFLDYITEHATHFEAIYLLKKPIAAGRYNYINPNYWLGVSVDVG